MLEDGDHAFEEIWVSVEACVVFACCLGFQEVFFSLLSTYEFTIDLVILHLYLLEELHSNYDFP